MAHQLHKRFPDQQVKSLLQRYLDKEIKLNYILEILGIKRRRFFQLLIEYQKDTDNFSIVYKRKKKTRTISKEIEENILKELSIERNLIGNKDIPIRSYNYSYIRDQLWSKYRQKVSVPTIIDRAKKITSIFLAKKENLTTEKSLPIM